MKKYFFLFAITLLIGCSSSQLLTYNQENGKDWNVQVKKSGMMSNFMVIINDSTVIDEAPNFFNGSMTTSSTYRGKDVRLLVNHSNGFLGLDPSYNAILFIDNKLFGNFKF